MLTLSLLQKLTVIGLLVGTILHYAEGIPAIKKSSDMVVIGPWGSAQAKKKEREKIIQKVLNFLEQETLCKL